MNFYNFMFDLEEILELSRLPSDSRQYRRRVARLFRKYDYLDELGFPGKRRWERVQKTSMLVSFAYCALFFAGVFMYGRTLTEPACDAAFWIIMAGLLLWYLLMLPAVRASFMLGRLRREYMSGVIQSLGRKLQKFTPGQFDAVNLFIYNAPPFTWGEPVRPGDGYGCYNCGCIFPADENQLDEFEPCCPDCGSGDYIFFASAEVPATKELLQILHELFIEE